MAASWEIGDVIRATTRLTASGPSSIQNVFHWRLADNGVIPDTAIPDLLQGIDDMFDTIQPGLHSSVTFSGIDVQNVTQGLVYPEYPWPVQTVGGGSNGLAVKQNAALILAGTERTRTVGRKFIGGWDIGSMLGQGFQSGTLTSLADFAVLYLADMAITLGARLIPVVVHYLADGTISYITDLIEATINNQVYTQRRRRSGVGV